jgi:hypothetical protein
MQPVSVVSNCSGQVVGKQEVGDLSRRLCVRIVCQICADTQIQKATICLAADQSD